MGKTMGQLRKEKGVGGPPLLKGSDIPARIQSVKITIKELREGGKDFKSPAIADLAKPVYEREAWPLNITNLRALSRVLGWEDEEFDGLDFDDLAAKAAGRTIILDVTRVNNPQTRKMVQGLAVHE
jgi:hypothetical protein